MEIHTTGHAVLAQQAGAHWVRINALLWSDVEPQPGERRWEALSDLEQKLRAAAENGLSVILIVRSTPAWAQKVPGWLCGPVRPESLPAFADFIADAVARYSAPPFNVLYWELGNEPDVDPSLIPSDFPFGCWGDLSDALYGGGYYAEMLKTVYPRLKAANPQAQVVIGGLLMDCDPVRPPETSPGSGQLKDCTPARYLEGILANGGGDYFDGVSFHAYDYYSRFGHYYNLGWHSSWDTLGPSVIAKASYLRGLLLAYGYPDKFLMNTETALICGRDGKEAQCQTEEFAQTKAYYLAQSYASAAGLGLRANIWYSIAGWRGSGLVAGEQALPAYEAFRFSAQMLAGVAPWGAVRQYPGVTGYEFRQGDDRIWLVWSLDDETHALTLPEAPTAVYDVFGNPQATGTDVSITLAPLYLIWRR